MALVRLPPCRVGRPITINELELFMNDETDDVIEIRDAFGKLRVKRRLLR